MFPLSIFCQNILLILNVSCQLSVTFCLVQKLTAERKCPPVLPLFSVAGYNPVLTILATWSIYQCLRKRKKERETLFSTGYTVKLSFFHICESISKLWQKQKGIKEEQLINQYLSSPSGGSNHCHFVGIMIRRDRSHTIYLLNQYASYMTLMSHH